MVDPLHKPKARGGLLTADHSKRGLRFVTVLDPQAKRVVLLEPWEHAVLVLCDGTRSGLQIVEMLQEGVEGQKVTILGVDRLMQLFERQGLLEAAEDETSQPPGPRTLAGLQLAYREWHRDPVKTGQILAGHTAPFIEVRESDIRVGLTPTVALPEEEEEEGEEEDSNAVRPPPVAIGTTLVMGPGDEDPDGRSLRSVFEISQGASGADRGEPKTAVGSLTQAKTPEPERMGTDDLELETANVAELLAAVDEDFERIESRPNAVEASEAESSKTADVVATQRVQPNVAVSLTPTMVGVAPEDGSAPVLLAPPRAPSKAGDRVGATVGPTPSPKERNVSGRVKRASTSSGIRAGVVIEDANAMNGPTEAEFAVFTSSKETYPSSLPPTRIESGDPSTWSDVNESPEDTARGAAHVHPRAREIFERLWARGLNARSSEEQVDSEGTGRRRRRRSSEAAAFQTAFEKLTAGELEAALAHFRALSERLPESERISAFVEAIEGTAGDGGPSKKLFEGFKGAVSESIASGRCPQCLAVLPSASKPCPECGLEVGALASSA